jgi:hypothetical protein
MSDFYGDLEKAPNCFGMSTKCISDQIHKKNSKFSRFFSKYFFQNLVKKYCLLRLFKHIFFRKIIFFSINGNFRKKLPRRILGMLQGVL